MKTNLLKTKTSSLLLFAIASTTHSEQAPEDFPMVKVSIFSMSPRTPTFLGTGGTEPAKLEIYSASVSEPIELKPPLYISIEDRSGKPISWDPGTSDRTEWVLILREKSSGELTLNALAAGRNDISPSSIILGNLMPYEIEMNFQDRNMIVAPSSFDSFKIKRSRLSLEARTIDLPYNCSISVGGLDLSSRYLLLVGPPHVQGSAVMTHRLLKIPTDLYEKQPELDSKLQ